MTYNSRENEYYEYLRQHIGGVQRVWNEILSTVVAECYPEEWSACEEAIRNHDASKYEEAEFEPYCNYFYPTEDCPKDEVAFDRAWLHHQKVNPHHWQYWVLIRDGGELVPMDMPIPEIVNMCCDWHSFSAKNPKSTAAAWYDKNQDKMMLSENTTEVVTFLLQYLEDPLQ